MGCEIAPQFLKFRISHPSFKSIVYAIAKQLRIVKDLSTK